MARVGALKKPRTVAQLASDERLRNRGRGPDIHVSKNMTGPDDIDPPKQNIDISTSGKAEATTTIEVVGGDQNRLAAKVADEAFMNEHVTIRIESSDDPTEPLFVPAGHNGVTQYIKRGEAQTIKRKFLYSLVTAKKVALVSTFGKDSNGKEFNHLAGPRSPTHRVVVLEDSPKGREMYALWMSQP